jgi:hypothetical protein
LPTKITHNPQSDNRLPEYNLEGKKGVRGEYAKAAQKGYSVRVLNEDGTVTIRDFIPKENTVLLDPDVKAYFPDSESVNHALRSLINLIPEKKATRAAERKVRQEVSRLKHPAAATTPSGRDYPAGIARGQGEEFQGIRILI